MNRKAISGSFYVGNKWLVQTHFILDNSRTRQVDLFCYKIKQVPFLFLLLFAFSIAWQSSDLPFSVLNRANIKISLLLFLNPLAYIPSSLFSPRSTWQTSNPAFAFSQAYIFHIHVSFFTSNLDLQHSVSALSTTDFFSATCLRRRL